LELRRRNGTVFFGTNDSGKEIDFIVPAGALQTLRLLDRSASSRLTAQDEERRYDKFQVTAMLTPEDEKRELGAFALADVHLKKGENLLLSLDEDETTLQWQQVTIERRNLILWLLSGMETSTAGAIKSP
jgi:hypothetical protein